MKPRYGQNAGFEANAVVEDKNHDLVLRRPGFDDRLPGLKVLHDPEFARACLFEAEGGDPGPVRANLMAHRIGKRAVVRLEARGLRRYARIRSVKDDAGRSGYEQHRDLWRRTRMTTLQIPAPIGFLARLGLSLYSELPGGVPDWSNLRVPETIGKAIGTLQSLSLPDLPVHGPRDELTILTDWYRRVVQHRPDRTGSLEKLLDVVRSALLSTSSAPVPTHRDLHDGQIVVDTATVGLLDFDTLCLSDPALDPGNLAAHIYLDGLLTGMDRSGAEAVLAASVPGLSLHDFRIWRRAALLRLAMIYTFSDTPQPVVDALVNEAADDRD